ncbi:hypothetical protein LI034_03380 [Clostridium perfringens]|jgi:hypothetical protein|uniref:hypothetical protein n=1 Tax=Clostridium perfringens TaxID=1502 RepID=UPI002247ABDB|nr:hypothetical protein [Clostridium perfringens]ELC8383207.1 hypothetical protein [Clostridium perfringens]MCX0360044.1 hypothetical protein [Clostridium perfringens]MDU1255843.1 hypothetical protein [Clostridium perfringens]MDU2656998.1 hypothetical protein [Clostridium perfringens]MDU7844075.1 hypothetical protein [Clostridium perfringens]
MYRIGTKCPKGGIYKCSKCGHERAIGQGDTFPPCTSCKQPGITWILVRATKN